MREVRDALRERDDRRVELGGERDHAREELVGVRREPDRRVGGAVGQHAVGVEEVAVVAHRVPERRVARRDGDAVGADRAVEEVRRLVGGVAERRRVQRRGVAAEPEVTFIADEPERGAHGAGRRRREAAHRDRRRRRVGHDRGQAVEHGQVARRLRRVAVGDHQRPAGVAVAAGPRAHVADGVGARPAGGDVGRDVDEGLIAVAVATGAGVERRRGHGAIRGPGRLELRRPDVGGGRGRGCAVVVAGRLVSAPVEAGEQHGGARRQRKRRGRGVDRGDRVAVGVDGHHRVVVVVLGVDVVGAGGPVRRVQPTRIAHWPPFVPVVEHAISGAAATAMLPVSLVEKRGVNARSARASAGRSTSIASSASVVVAVPAEPANTLRTGQASVIGTVDKQAAQSASSTPGDGRPESAPASPRRKTRRTGPGFEVLRDGLYEWRRRELNPRPQSRQAGVYECVRWSESRRSLAPPTKVVSGQPDQKSPPAAQAGVRRASLLMTQLIPS